MIHHHWGAGSLRCRDSVIPELAAVADLALIISPYDMSLVYGYRTPAEQAALVAAGKSHNPNSAHLFRLALDFQPAGFGDPFPRKGDSAAVIREKLERFEVCVAAWFEAADRLEFPLQWGNDWDCDGIPTGRDPDEKGWLQDLVHLQKAPPHRVKAALARAEIRKAARLRGEFIVS